jgi:hypothetical protein
MIKCGGISLKGIPVYFTKAMTGVLFNTHEQTVSGFKRTASSVVEKRQIKKIRNR